MDYQMYHANSRPAAITNADSMGRCVLSCTDTSSFSSNGTMALDANAVPGQHVPSQHVPSQHVPEPDGVSLLT